LAAVTAKISSAFASVTNTFSADPQTVLMRQYVSAPLAAQTISGSVTGQFKTRHTTTAGTSHLRISFSIRIVSNDDTTFRTPSPTGIVISTSNGMPVTTLTNRSLQNGTITTITLTNCTVQAGDRLVFEIGYNNADDVTINSATGEIEFGDSSATNLPVDVTTTAADNGWIEFNSGLLFQ
jgi:hypothetical protein